MFHHRRLPLLRRFIISCVFVLAGPLSGQPAGDTSVVRVLGIYDLQFERRTWTERARLVIGADSAALEYMRQHGEYLFSAGNTLACLSIGGRTRMAHWHPGRADSVVIEISDGFTRRRIRLAVGPDSVAGTEWLRTDMIASPENGQSAIIRGRRIGPAKTEDCHA